MRINKTRGHRFTVLLLGLLALGFSSASTPRPLASTTAELADVSGRVAVGATTPGTFGAAADAALATLERTWYHQPGQWNICVPSTCGSRDYDWGADSLTYTMFLRWKIAHDASIAPIASALWAGATNYHPCLLGTCGSWSDIPMWDSIAASRAFEITHERGALIKAVNAFATVDQSNAFALGACPTVAYQRPGGYTGLKTLETDSNYIKAALLLHHWTGDPAYLAKAIAKYAAVRRYFLDPALPLYTVYVFDDGKTCAQVPHRFYASVNGNMIYNGLTLASLTGNRAYFNDAAGTAQAVSVFLSDNAGYYADLQAENDIAEPLVEAMYDLGVEGHLPFARNWLLLNASVSLPDANGRYGRFFAGPPPVATVSAFSSNGGLALAIAAGALDGAGLISDAGLWRGAFFVPDPVSSAPATLAFTGRAIALIGTIGDRCCEAGHVRVFLDGRETVDSTGIWQNKSSAGQRLPGSVLFAWRWPVSGAHVISLQPGVPNAKEGGSYVHLQGYELVR